MPYRSEKQRAYLHIHEPELAERWDKKYGGKVKSPNRSRKRKPEKKRRKSKEG